MAVTNGITPTSNYYQTPGVKEKPVTSDVPVDSGSVEDKDKGKITTGSSVYESRRILDSYTKATADFKNQANSNTSTDKTNNTNSSSTVSNNTNQNNNEIKEFDDFRDFILKRNGRDISNMDLRDKGELLKKAWINEDTPWPSADKMPDPSVYDPKKIIEEGKDPGLGVRDLHNQGITGKGVHVAVIDQVFNPNHKDFKDNVVEYNEVPSCEGLTPQMHASAEASLLVGEQSGTAPDSKLHYWAACNSGKPDYTDYATSLDQIIKYNKEHPDEKIRVVDVPKGYDKKYANLDWPNVDKWIDAKERAKKEGIIVVDTIQTAGAGCPFGKDRNDPNNYDICYFMHGKEFSEDKLYVPVDNRSYADFQSKDGTGFQNNPSGGLSWSTPYLSGVIAMGLQVNPNLNEDQIRQYLRETGTDFHGSKMVNPKAFISRIQSDMAAKK